MMQRSTLANSSRFYGWVRQQPDIRDLKFRPSNQLLTAMPDHFDLFSPRLPAPLEPCLNQGQQGSCGPNTAVECLCVDAERDEGVQQMKLPSRQFIYYNTRVLMGTVSQDSGVDNRTMLKALGQYGWCDDNLCHYSDQMAQIAVKPSDTAYAQAATRLITDYEAVAQTQDSIMASIAAGTPFIFGFSVYQDFESQATGTTGIVTMPTRRSGRPIGGHDIAAGGYNFTGVDLPGELPGMKWPNGTIKCRNHWYNGSVPWGDRGYAYVPIGYFLDPNLSGDFWRIVSSGLPSVNPPTPPPPPPVNTTRTIVITGAATIVVDGKVV